PDTILRRCRCDAEAYWRIWALTRLRTAGLDRATIIDDSLSHYSAISLDLVPTGAVAGGPMCGCASGRGGNTWRWHYRPRYSYRIIMQRSLSKMRGANGDLWICAGFDWRPELGLTGRTATGRWLHENLRGEGQRRLDRPARACQAAQAARPGRRAERDAALPGGGADPGVCSIPRP